MARSWRNIAITLIDPDFGEQTAQACAIAWLQHCGICGSFYIEGCASGNFHLPLRTSARGRYRRTM